MKTNQPKYTVISDVNDKYNENDEVATAVTTAVLQYDDDYDDNATYLSKRRKARRSCCGICCCVTSVMCGCFLLLLIMIGIAYYSMIVYGVRMITVETSIDFPIVTVSEKELEVVSDDIDDFMQSILNDDGCEGGMTTKDLIISSRIVNGAISQSDYLRGHAQVIMKENEFIFQTSLPMDMFPGGSHRFFVSTMDTTTTKTDSAITTTSFDLGKKLSKDYDGPLFVTELLSYLAATTGKDPEWVMNVLSMQIMGQEVMTPEELADKTNILQSLRDDPSLKDDPNMQALLKFIDGIGSIRVEADRMIVHARCDKNNSSMIKELPAIHSPASAGDDEIAGPADKQDEGEDETTGDDDAAVMNEPPYFLRHP